MSARPLRRLAAALAAAAAIALAGCVGIPTSGPVIAGPAVDEVDPEFVVTPNGPSAGMSPQDILGGFMQAVRAPQSDYQVARSFLTPELAATWDPDAGVLVRTDAAQLVVRGDEAAPVIDYAFSSNATVDATGHYVEAQTASARSLEFAFAQVDGQWRISAAADGIVLSAASFPRSFTSYALYYFDPSGRYLVPDVRWFPSRQSTPNLVVAALLAGPDEWLRRAVVSDFPAGTVLGPRSVVISAGTATVDLSAQASNATPEQLDRMRQQLVATLDVADARISADGVPLSVGQSTIQATIDPQPAGAVLVGTGTEFGYGSPNGVTPIPGISPAIVGDGATAAVVAHDQLSASYLAADGTVRHVVVPDAAVVVDQRPGLVAPALDGYGWTWSGGAGAPLEAFDPSGAAAGITAGGIPADATITGLAVSRDSTRLLVALAGGSGPRLLAFGIVRSGGAPTGLDQPIELAAPDGALVGVSWVDDRSAVVVADAGGSRSVRVVAIGAPGEDLAALSTGATAVGGRGGSTGIRALADGEVLAPSGTGDWTDAGFAATFLGVQQ